MAARVLLVDDVRQIRFMVRAALRVRGGFEVVGEAADGAQAELLARQLQPDLVVLDLGLPDIAGSELLTRLRTGAPDCRIVVFSGAHAPEIAERVEGFVLKDAELDYLVDRLEQLVSARLPARTVELPGDVSGVGPARAFARQAVADWGLQALSDDVQLVVSELVANAVVHTGSAPELRLTLTEAAVRVEVRDTGGGTPDPKPPSSTGESGRGMFLVSALTAAWGVEQVAGGKLVWADIARPATTGEGEMAARARPTG